MVANTIIAPKSNKNLKPLFSGKNISFGLYLLYFIVLIVFGSGSIHIVFLISPSYEISFMVYSYMYLVLINPFSVYFSFLKYLASISL